MCELFGTDIATWSDKPMVVSVINEVLQIIEQCRGVTCRWS
jgi:hypothetical protein